MDPKEFVGRDRVLFCAPEDDFEPGFRLVSDGTTSVQRRQPDGIVAIERLDNMCVWSAARPRQRSKIDVKLPKGNMSKMAERKCICRCVDQGPVDQIQNVGTEHLEEGHCYLFRVAQCRIGMRNYHTPPIRALRRHQRMRQDMDDFEVASLGVIDRLIVVVEWWFGGVECAPFFKLGDMEHAGQDTSVSVPLEAMGR